MMFIIKKIENNNASGNDETHGKGVQKLQDINSHGEQKHKNTQNTRESEIYKKVIIL